MLVLQLESSETPVLKPKFKKWGYIQEMGCAETAGKERSPCVTRGVLLLKLAATSPTNSSNKATCLRRRNIKEKKRKFFSEKRKKNTGYL
jgi:hypothetical protein